MIKTWFKFWIDTIRENQYDIADTAMAIFVFCVVHSLILLLITGYICLWIDCIIAAIVLTFIVGVPIIGAMILNHIAKCKNEDE